MKVISEDKVIKVLDFIKDFQKKEGRSPSFRQIAKGCSFPSLATAQKYVAILQSRGMIEKNSMGKINIPRNLSKGKTVIAPLVGTIACGTPILAEENIEETFQLPTAIFGNAKSMLLRASGDSMTGVGINDGDLIVAEICDTADEGDIVVATAGKEKNQIFVVSDIDDKYCYLVDGKRLKLTKPKKKSLKHVQKASKIGFDAQKLKSGQENVNAEIREILKERSLICLKKM